MDKVKALEEYVKTLEGLIDEADVAGLRYEYTGTYPLATGVSWVTVPENKLTHITLTAGTWVIGGHLVVPSNSTGRRAMRLYDATNDEAFPLSEVNQNAVTDSNAVTRMQTATTVTVTEDTEITLQVAQNSGTQQTVSVGIEAVLVASYGEVPTGGTSSYTDLQNKPQIEGVTLVGNKTFDDFGLVVPTKTSDLTNDSDFVEDANYVHTDSNYTSAEKTKLAGIASGAEANVQSDWSQTSTSADDYIKNKPAIPSKTSDLTNDSGYIATETDPVFTASAAHGITSSDISDWNNKSDFSGDYDDLTNKPTIPSKTSDLTNDSGFITAETDPVFTASPAHGISSSDISSWNGKSTVSVNRKTTTGTNIADLTIDGTTTKLYAPTGGGGGGTITEVKTTAGAHQTIDVTSGTAQFAVPTDTNHLTNGAGFISTETDPVFTASAAAGITSSDITAWNGKSDFSGDYDDLTNKPTIPSKTSDLTNDSGYITTETDPTVPSWAKASTKPTYTASEVGALPDTTTIPTKTSDLNNDSGFVSGLMFEEKSIKDNVTVNGSGTKYTDGNASIAKTGYTPLGVVGFRVINASSSGTNGANVVISHAYISGTTAYFRVKNTETSSAKVRIYFTVLYAKA